MIASIRTLGAVDPTYCQRIMCGLVNASTADKYACAVAGYVGVLTALSPICQQLAGGGAVDVFDQQNEAVNDQNAGIITIYEQAPAPPGPESPPSETAFYEPLPPEFDPLPAPEAESDPAAAESSQQPAGETGTEEDEFDPFAYFNLIGDSKLTFNSPGGQLADWWNQAQAAAAKLPWWIWLIAASGIYYATQKGKARRR